jgi:pimeloyl-ACP methyl ester carboxylesterase
MRQVTHNLLSAISAAALLIGWAQPSDGSVDNPEPAARDVQFRSRDIMLAGTLTVPSKLVAAVVLVHGAGKTLRDVPLARTLAGMSVATLTYDKRGVGKSAGIYAGPEAGTNNTDPRNLDLLAADASAAVKELAHELPSPRVPVGLFGFSQAGWIIPLAAARTPDVRFVILWSGPLVTTLEQLRFQHLTDGKADFWDHHTEEEVREHIRSDPDRYTLVATDPADSLRKLSIPGLWLYGDRDVYVPVRLSIERLQALAASGKPFEYRLFPGLGHDLRSDQAISASLDWLMNTVVQGRRGN